MSADGDLIEVIKAEVQKTTKLVELERLGRGGGCKKCPETSRDVKSITGCHRILKSRVGIYGTSDRVDKIKSTALSNEL